MLKLLNAYFSRLAKWTIFRILMLLMLAGGIALVFFMRKQPVVFQVPFFAANLIFPHYIGVVIGLFNYPFFTNGTIRNQLAVGHRRSSVFFADWAVSNAFSVALYLILSLSIYVTAAIVCDTGVIAWRSVAEGLILCGLQVMLFATITQLFCVILKGVKSFLAIYLGNQILVVAGIGIMTLEKIPKAVLYFFPTAVSMNLNCFKDSGAANPLMEGANGIRTAASVSAMTFDFLPAAGAVILEIAAVYLIGVLYFRKTDLN